MGALVREAVTAHAIRTESDHARALDRLDALWGAASGTPEAAERNQLADQISAFEALELQSVLPPPNPGHVITYKLRELGWSQCELAKLLGWGSGRVSEIISGKRQLTLAMVRDLSDVLGIDPTILVRAADPDHPSVPVTVPLDLALAARAQGFAGQRSLNQLVASLLAEALLPTEPTVTAFRALQRPPTTLDVVHAEVPAEHGTASGDDAPAPAPEPRPG